MLAASDDRHRARGRARARGARAPWSRRWRSRPAPRDPSRSSIPTTGSQAVGQAQAEQDIAECRELAESAGASAGSGEAGRAAGSTVAGGAIGGATGAVGGAILGSPGTGAAVGAATGATAGLMRSIFGGGRGSGPSAAYRNVVDRCLRERGYEPAGWE